jgi:hypothetical protein
MKALNTIAWVIAILAIGAVWARWAQILWYFKNQELVDTAVETADSLQQVGVLK